MVHVTFIQSDGREQTVDVSECTSLMRAAVENDVCGIVAECGGAAACGTCQVSVGEAWASRLPPPGELELSILDESDPSRRLSCQIKITPEIDGLVVHVPKSQNA